MKKRVTIDFDEEVYNKFKYHCKNNAFKISTKLELLMHQEIEGGVEPKQKGYDSLIKFFKEMMDQRVQQSKPMMMSGGVVMPKQQMSTQVESQPQQPNTQVSGKRIPTISQLRYRKGF